MKLHIALVNLASEYFPSVPEISAWAQTFDSVSGLVFLGALLELAKAILCLLTKLEISGFPTNVFPEATPLCQCAKLLGTFH